MLKHLMSSGEQMIVMDGNTLNFYIHTSSSFPVTIMVYLGLKPMQVRGVCSVLVIFMGLLSTFGFSISHKHKFPSCDPVVRRLVSGEMLTNAMIFEWLITYRQKQIGHLVLVQYHSHHYLGFAIRCDLRSAV